MSASFTLKVQYLLLSHSNKKANIDRCYMLNICSLKMMYLVVVVDGWFVSCKVVCECGAAFEHQGHPYTSDPPHCHKRSESNIIEMEIQHIAVDSHLGIQSIGPGRPNLCDLIAVLNSVCCAAVPR